jgi:hypothetical protein
VFLHITPVAVAVPDIAVAQQLVWEALAAAAMVEVYLLRAVGLLILVAAGAVLEIKLRLALAVLAAQA